MIYRTHMKIVISKIVMKYIININLNYKIF